MMNIKQKTWFWIDLLSIQKSILSLNDVKLFRASLPSMSFKKKY